MDDTLEQFVEKIQNMTADQLKYSKVNLDDVMEMVEHCRGIKNSITYLELKMLYYLRNGRFGELYRFYVAAKQSYQANLTLSRIKSRYKSKKEFTK